MSAPRSPHIESEPRSAGFSTVGEVVSPYTIEQVVAWGEMDALGHVNNIYYLRWFENVRFHYFEDVGINAYLHENSVGPILGSSTICYLSPVQFPDRVLVSTTIRSMGRSSFVMENRAWSTAQDRLVAYGDAYIVMVDYANQSRPCPVPPSIRAAIEALESTHPQCAGT